MKSFAILLTTTMVAGIILSCNSNKTSEKTGEDTTATDTTTVTMPPPTPADTTITVPDKTRTAFEKKYPNATSVVWVRKNRGSKMTSPDSTDYKVTYRLDGVDYTTWYEWDGDWIATNARISNDKLPQAVNNAIASKYPGYTITEVDMENDKDMTRYEVDLEKGTEKVKIHFSPAGKEIKVKEKMK